jgi:hypothetical protein
MGSLSMWGAPSIFPPNEQDQQDQPKDEIRPGAPDGRDRLAEPVPDEGEGAQRKGAGPGPVELRGDRSERQPQRSDAVEDKERPSAHEASMPRALAGSHGPVSSN